MAARSGRSRLVDEVADQIAARPPDRVMFWSGAGISGPAPTNLPSGWELTQRAFDAFFEAGALDTVLAYHRLVGWLSPTLCPRQPARVRLPRLETVLGAAADQDAANVLTVLDDVRSAEPGWMHRCFAAHLRAGGRHVTANFDRCIERTYGDMYGAAAPDDRILHFHGALDTTTTPDQLGATLAQLERGFADEVADRLRAALCGGVEVIVVVGYSGSDFFDVDTAVAGLPPGSLDGVEVVWVAHGRCAWHELDPAEMDEPFTDTPSKPPPPDARGQEPPMAQHLRRAGASVRFVCGVTERLLSLVQGRWGLTGVGMIDPSGHRHVREITATSSAEHRAAATFMLYRTLGLLPEVDRMLRDGTPPVARDELRVARSDGLWEQGRYSDLRRWWARQHDADPAQRSERIGAALWTQGRLVPALLWLDLHRRRCIRRGEDTNARLLAEIEGRVVEHMARTPDLAPVARLLARRAVRLIDRRGQDLGVHLHRRRTDLHSSLQDVAGFASRDPATAAASRQWFVEAGNVHAALSYQHRSLRDGYDPAIPAPELTRRYRGQQRRAQIIGSTSAYWRVLLLPGAHRVFTFREAVTGALALQFGWWHRIRLVGRFGWLRLRLRLRRR